MKTMNYKNAIKILDFDIEKDELNIDTIKKKYRMLALLYHPDKNKSEEALEKFHSIQNAYEFFMKNYNTFDNDIDNDNDIETEYFYNSKNTSYTDLLHMFLKSIIEEGGFGSNTSDVQSKIYQNIFCKISKLCEDKTVELLKNIDKNLLLKIYDFLFKYQKILFVNDTLLLKVREIIDEKIKNDECIILNPILEDLFDHNIYKLQFQDRIMLIPLWHHELIYDISGADLYVRCYPILTDNISIDSNNNIIIDMKYDIRELLSKEEIKIDLGKHQFCFNVEDLHVLSQQTAILKGVGIPIINSKDIYSVNERSNLILNIQLF
jgi:DnaJ-class molecular chaperone